MRLVDRPEHVAALPEPAPEAPWRVLVSGCMLGRPCAVDGTDMGLPAALPAFLRLPNVQAIPFCAEDTGIGTPRGMPDIHGGDGCPPADPGCPW